MKKASDNALIEAYDRIRNVWKVAVEFGMCGQSVHERLTSLGAIRKMNLFTKADLDELRMRYALYRDAGKLDILARRMGRTKQFICRKAKGLGLTNNDRRDLWKGHWKYMTEDEAEILFEKFRKSKLGFNQFCDRFGLGRNGFHDTMKRFFPDTWEHLIELKTPKSTPYQLGRNVEYAVRDDFKHHGFLAFRSPASKGPFDVIAIRKGLVVFVQCKRGMVLQPKEWNEFLALAKSVDALPLLAGRPTGRNLKYWRLNAPKDGKGKRQPKTVITLNQIEEATE